MLRMMLNNIIEKQIRRSAFNLPYSWSVISDVDKQLVRESSSSSNQVNSEDKVKSEKRIEDNPFYGRYANKIKQTIDREGANISQAIGKVFMFSNGLIVILFCFCRKKSAKH